MPKLVNVGQLSDSFFVVTVQLETGHKEKWVYHVERINGLLSYTMVNREDA